MGKNSNSESFGRWLQEERKKRGWTVRELARRADVSHAALSNVLTGKRNAGHEVARKVAEAMGVPVTEAFRRAEILPGTVEEPIEFSELLAIMRELDPEERLRILEYARWRLQDIAYRAYDEETSEPQSCK